MAEFQTVRKNFIDIFSFIRSTIANYHVDSGLLIESPIDKERFVDESLLMEAPSTNELLWNRDLSNGVWVSNTSLLQTGDGIDGATDTAWRIQDLQSISASFSRQTLSGVFQFPSSDLTHIFSVYIKKTTGTPSNYPLLSFTAFGGASDDISGHVLNTTDGSTVPSDDNSSGNTATVEDRGEWWRVNVKLIQTQSNLNTEGQIHIYPAWNSDGSGTKDNATNGQCFYDYGQIEMEREHSSTVILTEASDVTRSGDFCKAGFIVDWFEDDNFTLYGSFSTLSNDPDGTERTYISLGDSSGSMNYIAVELTAIDVITVIYEDSLSVSQTIDFAFSQDVKFAISYSSTTGIFAAAINGIYQESSGTITETLPANALRLGADELDTSTSIPDNVNFSNVNFSPNTSSELALIALTE